MALGDLGEAERARDLSDRSLVRGIAKAMHEDDRDRVVVLRARVRQSRADGLQVRRGLDGSVGEHALVDLDHVRIEKLGLHDRAGKNLGARLIADLERVAEAARGDEQRPFAAALEQRVGRNRGAHLDCADRPRRDRLALGEPEKAADRFDRRVLVGRTFGEQLLRMQPPARIAADHVGERAAAIDPEIPAAFCRHDPHVLWLRRLWRRSRMVL